MSQNVKYWLKVTKGGGVRRQGSYVFTEHRVSACKT